MQTRCVQCGEFIEPGVVKPVEGEASLCAVCRGGRMGEPATEIRDPEVAVSESTVSESMVSESRDFKSMAPEFDRRGIRLPARARVGGIIIPQ